MGSVDFKDLDEVPDGVRTTAAAPGVNAVHLAGALRHTPYPPAG